MEFLSPIIDFIKEWSWIPLVLIYLAVILTILLENKNVSKALAYLTVLIVLPVVGFIIFYFFGRDYWKRKKFGKKEKLEQIRAKEFFQRILDKQPSNIYSLEEEYLNLAKPSVILLRQQNSLLFNYNQVKLLINGEEKFPEVFAEISKAMHHIHLEYYMLTDDDVGNKLVDLLVEKSEQGVEVRVMVDGLGSSDIGKLSKRLKRAKIPYYEFMPVRFSNLASSNNRNHRKTLVIDGRVAFLGGINMDDRYLNNGKHELYWRDTHIKIEGPAVNRMQFEFMMDWKFVSKESIPLEEPYLNHSGIYDHGVPVTIAGSGPNSSRPHGMDTMVSLIHNASEYVRITNPYFIPSDELRSALITASNSGVKVDVIIPGKSDSLIVQRASFSYLKEMLENGVNIYLYKKGFVHAKTMSVDNKVSFIGTLNTDIRSFYINFETSAVIYDPEIAGKLDEQFEIDLLGSEKVELDRWLDRSIRQRLVDSFFRLLTPLL